MQNLLEIKNLSVEYETKKGILGKIQTVHAVNNLSLDIKQGEILAIAGESGCGKSTLGKALMLLEPAKKGTIISGNKNILQLEKGEVKDYRKKSQMIFQNPYASLNPKMKIIDTLKEPLKINTSLSDNEINQIVTDTALKVGLDENSLNQYPHEFSGGQRQRIAIARALVLKPKFIVADEPVSALDVSIQAQIINLLKELKNDFNLTIMFISHDLSVIKYLSDRVAIMYLGEIVELGCTSEIFNSPAHPYTKALLSAVPQLANKVEKRILLNSDLPSPTDLPSGCKFHTRCQNCMPECCEKEPNKTTLSNSHYVKCFLYP